MFGTAAESYSFDCIRCVANSYYFCDKATFAYNVGQCSDSSFTFCTNQYSKNATNCVAAFGFENFFDLDSTAKFSYVVNGITLYFDGLNLSMKGPLNGKGKFTLENPTTKPIKLVSTDNIRSVYLQDPVS